jgi:NAD(P)-dependent dehydrogenase (short-subunit alcohol dehydrogenase family)
MSELDDATRLDGRVVVVTGGGSGIGRATAELCARRGAAVVVLDRQAEHAEEVAGKLVAGGGRALALACDVADDAAVGDAMARAGSTLGRVSGLVTSAGIFHGPDMQPIDRISIDDFFRVLAVNLGGTFSAIRNALPQLADGGGAIVTIASTAAIRGHGYGAGYTASKGGVDALTRLVAVQCGPRGVRANCVCPGGVDTPMTAGTFATPEAKQRAARSIPLGRYAEAADLADVATWLLSDGARYVTGQTVAVEGGSTVA